MRAWESRGSGPPRGSRAEPLRGSIFCREAKIAGAEPLAASHCDVERAWAQQPQAKIVSFPLLRVEKTIAYLNL